MDRRVVPEWELQHRSRGYFPQKCRLSQSRGWPCPCLGLGDVLLQTHKMRVQTATGRRAPLSEQVQDWGPGPGMSPASNPDTHGEQPTELLEHSGHFYRCSLNDSSPPRWPKQHREYLEETEAVVLQGSQLAQQGTGLASGALAVGGGGLANSPKPTPSKPTRNSMSPDGRGTSGRLASADLANRSARLEPKWIYKCFH